MTWKVWLPWVLVALLVVALLIWIIIWIRKKPEGIKLIEAKLDMRKKQVNVLKEALEAEQRARKKAERQRAEHELAFLEEQHKDQIKALGDKERDELEKAKKDPESGAEYMRDLLGIGSSTG